MRPTEYTQVDDSALIAVEGADAVAFLHAQLTSDVAGLGAQRTQYSGYCTPQGRLLATLLLWRRPERIDLQLPRVLAEPIRARLAKYVLRSRVTLSDTSNAHRLFGVWGAHAPEAIAALAGAAPAQAHQIVTAGDIGVVRLPGSRFLIVAPPARAGEVLESLAAIADARQSGAWSRLDIDAGVPVITPPVQEQYVPQMVNLDLLGGVSYDKGCYPGQEIVARTHYLGRLKQRMYRVEVHAAHAPQPGDALYSSEFGADQASGSIVSAVADGEGRYAALTVLQRAAVSGPVHYGAPDGPRVVFRDLPYPLPD